MRADQQRELAPSLSTRDRLLQATESLVLRYGAAKLSTRSIGTHAAVRWTLVTYHFGSLPNLLSELTMQNIERIEAARTTLLSKAALTRKKSARLDALIAAYTDPLLLTSSAFSQASAYGVVRAILLTENVPVRDRAVARINASVGEVVDALTKVLPDLTRDVITIRLRFVSGAIEILLPHIDQMGLYPLRNGDRTKRDALLREQLHFTARAVLTA